MSDLAILNMPVAAPPKPASQSAPAGAQAADNGAQTDFATELNRQLRTTDDTNPGPGRDAGKGRETGESAPQTAATEEQPVQGQSATSSGREAGTDRLALVAQLLAAAMTAAAVAPTAPAQPEQAVEGEVPAAAVMAANSATASASAAILTVAANPEPQAGVAGNASAPADAATVEPATGGTLPVAPAPQATPAVQSDQKNVQPTAVQPQPTTDETTTTTAGSESDFAAAALATNAETPANPAEAPPAANRPVTAKASEAKTARQPAATADAQAGDKPAMPAAATAVTAVTESKQTGEGAKQTAKLLDSTKDKQSVAREATAPAATRSEADQSLAGGEFARLAGRQAGVTEAAAAVRSDKAAIPEPVAHDVIGQLVAGAKMLRQGPVTEMRLQLKPEFLGRVDLKVTMESGVMSARIVVDNPQVKAAIEANLSQLKQDLAQHGIALQGMTVGLGSGRGEQSADARQNAFRDYAPQTRAPRVADISPAAIASQRSGSSSHRLDMVL